MITSYYLERKWRKLYNSSIIRVDSLKPIKQKLAGITEHEINAFIENVGFHFNCCIIVSHCYSSLLQTSWEEQQLLTCIVCPPLYRAAQNLCTIWSQLISLSTMLTIHLWILNHLRPTGISNNWRRLMKHMQLSYAVNYPVTSRGTSPTKTNQALGLNHPIRVFRPFMPLVFCLSDGNESIESVFIWTPSARPSANLMVRVGCLCNNCCKVKIN